VTLNALIIRHGQTEANRDGAIQGQGDSPLTEEGIASTLRKAAALKSARLDAVYCSDLPRAMRTWDIVAAAFDRAPRPVYTAELREIDFGEYTGMSRDTIMDTVRRHKADTTLRYPGGESGDDLKARTARFFERIKKRHQGQTVLLVTHYGVIETAVRLFCDHPGDGPVVVEDDAVIELRFDGDAPAALRRL